jgi:hypothetical protein
LGSTTPASASKFEKMAKKHDFFHFSQDFFKTTALTSNVFGFLEHIFKKMGSTEIVMSSVRLSVCPSVRL